MKTLLFILSLFILIGCHIDKSDNDIIIKRTYDYIGSDKNSNLSKMINKGKVFVVDTLVKIKAVYIDFPICNRRLFSHHDIDFMIRQNNNQSDFRLYNDTINKIFILPVDTLKKLQLSNKFKNVFFTISKPLYSKDYKRVLISVDFHCSECGLGKLLILAKIGNDWKVIYVCETWIS